MHCRLGRDAIGEPIGPGGRRDIVDPTPFGATRASLPRIYGKRLCLT